MAVESFKVKARLVEVVIVRVESQPQLESRWGGRSKDSAWLHFDYTTTESNAYWKVG
jgi:hypothetical protein